MSGASEIFEGEEIAAAKSSTDKNSDASGTDSSELNVRRNRRRGNPAAITILHRHIHNHNVNLRITGDPPGDSPVIVHLPPFQSPRIEVIPGMGIPAAETEGDDAAASEMRRPGHRRMVGDVVTRHHHIHEHNVIMNVLEAPENCARILVHLPNTSTGNEIEDDWEAGGEEGADNDEDPYYMSGPLDTRKMEIVPGNIVMVDMRTSPNFPGGIYMGDNYVMGRDDNTMRIVTRHLSSFNAFYRLRYARGRCRCFPADEVVRRANSWEGRVYRDNNRWGFAVMCLTGLSSTESRDQGFKLMA